MSSDNYNGTINNNLMSVNTNKLSLFLAAIIYIMRFEELGIISDDQLRNYAEQMGLRINYIGFAENLRTLPENGLSIIKLGSNHQGGTHWTMLWVEPEYVVYFDSYGVGPEDNIIRLAGRRTISYNTKQIQGYTESFCGIWALCAAAFIAKKKHKATALNEFVDQYNAV